MSNDRVWLYCERCGALHWVGKWWPRGLAGEAIVAGEDAIGFMSEHLTWCRDRGYYGGGRQGLSAGFGPDRLWVRPIGEFERHRLAKEAQAIGQPDSDERTAPEFVVVDDGDERRRGGVDTPGRRGA